MWNNIKIKKSFNRVKPTRLHNLKPKSETSFFFNLQVANSVTKLFVLMM